MHMQTELFQAYSLAELECIYQEQKALYTPEELTVIHEMILEKRNARKAENQADVLYCIIILVLIVTGFFIPVVPNLLCLVFDVYLIAKKFPLVCGRYLSRETVYAMMSFQFPVIGLLMSIYFSFRHQPFSKYCLRALMCSVMIRMLLLSGGIQF